ncbi:MAG: TlpA disulfide reductase family protein [Bacteroidota bacterium]
MKFLKNNILVLCVFVCVWVLNIFASTKVHIEIIGFDGKHPSMATIKVGKLIQGGVLANYIAGDPIKTIDVESDGKKEFEIENPGYYKIVVSAPDHEFATIPLIIQESGENIELKIQLEPVYQLFPDNDFYLIGDWNHFDMRRADKMSLDSTGNPRFEGSSSLDSVSYQLVIRRGGQTSAPTINGTTSTHFIRDGFGGYKSTVPVIHGKFTITYNLQKYNMYRNVSLPKISFDTAHAFLEAISNLTTQFIHERVTLWNALDKKRKNEPEISMNVDRSILAQKLIEKMSDTTENLLVRQFAAVSICNPFSWSELSHLAKYGKSILQIVPPSSPMWSASYRDGFISVTRDDSNNVLENVLQQFADTNPEKQIRIEANLRLIEKAKVDKKNALHMVRYQQFLEKYPQQELETRDKMMLGMFVPDSIANKKISRNKKMPDFEFQSMDSRGNISSKKLTGKYYLLDFWAIWCSGCIQEMPNMGELYKKYKGKNFDIVSVSFDKASDIDKFRSKKFRMPWYNVALTQEEQEKIMATFEVIGFPKPILVDPKGYIIATDLDARGEDLKKTLARIFRK